MFCLHGSTVKDLSLTCASCLRVSTVEHELHFEGTELMHIELFYSTSHLAQLLHNALPPFFFTPLIPFTNVIMINSLFKHQGAALENLTLSTFEELNFYARTELLYFFQRYQDLCMRLSMTLSMHGTSDYSGILTSHVFRPGFKLGSTAWKSRALTT